MCESSTSIAALALALTTLGCGGATPPVSNVDSAPPVVETSALGPDDVFDVRVFGEADLSGQYRVAHDGSISFPLAGTLQVAGLTPSQVADLITTRLREGRFLLAPQVSVLVKEYNSKRVSVFGQVQRPGTFPYQDSMDIVHAITLAGGFTALAEPNHTTVTRRRGPREQRVRIPVESIGQGRSGTFYLRPGDRIYVPESVW